jgi:hypothetical protein
LEAAVASGADINAHMLTTVRKIAQKVDGRPTRSDDDPFTA